MKRISWMGLVVFAGLLCSGVAVSAEDEEITELQHECTSWIVLSDLTKNNTNILHKNRDALSRKSCVIFSPKNSPRKWIAIGDGGQTAMGMTSTGLAGAMNSGELCINAPTDNKKKPPLKFFRAILDSCDTAAQAVEKCKELLAAGDYWYKDKGSIFFFLDAKEGYICEFTAKNFTVQHITSGFSVRANIWMNPGMQTYSRSTVSNYLDSAARMYRAYSGLNALLDEKGKIELLDIFELSRSHKMPKGSSQGRSLCFGATNSAVSMEVDREYPDVLSTIYAAIGHPRRTVYIPLPVCTEQVLPEMLNGKWDAASWKRLKELKLSAPIPEEWTKFEADSLATYKKAQADARALLKQGKRTEAIKLLNDTAAAIWNDGKVLLGL